MLYEFITNSGDVLEADFPMSNAPDVGQVVEIDGVKATRILSVPAEVRCDNWKPYASDRLPKGLPGCRHDKSGRPIIETRGQEREVMSKFGYERE